jgi:DNA polymerase I-like protein with 3'-5' exonuclease and polymerase domains
MILSKGSGEALMVADVETFGTDPLNGKLLGVALCHVSLPEYPIYVPIQWYIHETSSWKLNPDAVELFQVLEQMFKQFELIGHNYAYDKLWLDKNLCTDTTWHACTRLMWHMASNPVGPRGYGLKDAQVELLGWDKRGDEALEAQVKARGGTIKQGGHYLADLSTLGHYACLDASSTALLYKHLSPFFEQYDYWWMLKKMVEYSWLLQECTSAGILVDTDALQKQIEILTDTKEAYGARFLELTKPHIERLERFWREDRAAKYISDAARTRFLSSWDLQKKFNLSSDKDKRELFYESLKLPVVVETDGGKPSTGVEAVKLSLQSKPEYLEMMDSYEITESAETMLNSFAKPWLESIDFDSRLRPRFNPCGTVSYRLSGFKPYLLNAPFDERELMSCLRCDEGWEGVHADFVSVEPAVTAHYSQDPHLLKVFREGFGDVYLDLALTLFPGDEELKIYNPNEPVSGYVKERLNKKRKVAKIIQLAVQYTGTKYTISKNLTQAGYPTTLAEADALVNAYWVHFHKVKLMNEALTRKHDSQGYLRNVVGRVIRAPYKKFKDTPNRFIQSSAHDLLSFWVLIIARMVKERGIVAKSMIVDCHDSTSWQAPKEHVAALEQVFKDALTELNELVRMTVPIKIEMKRFSSLAGLKGDG